MKKIFFIWIVSILLNSANAQTAIDFNMTDCNDTMHHLFADYLDNEEVVIIEFFMTCPSCIEVGQKLSPMYDQLAIDYPGQVNFFAFNFNDDFDCSVANNFVTDNAINAVPFDSGGAQLAYYGGFGMPSVAIVGGSQHEVIYFDKTSAGVNDTAAMDSAIRNFFNTIGIEDESLNFNFSIFPNPTTNVFNLELNMTIPSKTKIEMLDMTSKVVKSISNSLLSVGLNKFQVETSELPDGMYFISIQNDNKISKYKLSVKH